MPTATVNQVTVRGRANGGEANAPWLAPENTPFVVAAATVFGWRALLLDTGIPAGRSYIVEYSTDQNVWIPVTTSTPVKIAGSSFYADHDATTNQLTLPGGASFVAGSMQTGDDTSIVVNLFPNQCTELQWALSADSSLSGGPVYLRVAWSSGPTAIEVYSNLGVFTVIPAITATTNYSTEPLLDALIAAIGTVRPNVTIIEDTNPPTYDGVASLPYVVLAPMTLDASLTGPFASVTNQGEKNCFRITDRFAMPSEKLMREKIRLANAYRSALQTGPDFAGIAGLPLITSIHWSRLGLAIEGAEELVIEFECWTSSRHH